MQLEGNAKIFSFQYLCFFPLNVGSSIVGVVVVVIVEKADSKVLERHATANIIEDINISNGRISFPYYQCRAIKSSVLALL